MNYLGYTPLSVPTSPALNSEFSDIRSVEYSLAAHDAIAQIIISISGSDLDAQTVQVKKKGIAYHPDNILFPIEYPGLAHAILFESSFIQYQESILEPYNERISYNPSQIEYVALDSDSNAKVKFYADRIRYFAGTNKGVYILVDREPTFEEYMASINAKVRMPCYKIELLRWDESVITSIEQYVVNNSGSVDITNEEGVRRTCSFKLHNVGNFALDVAKALTICSKFRVSLGEYIDGLPIYFTNGVFLFNDPSIVGGLSQREISVSGTDKWAMLNGQCGGIIEGTYIVKAGSTVGDAIRRTLNLDIVNDPIEPNIDPQLENEVVTYDISKSAGSTVADIFLDIALNVNATCYYDANGRFTLRKIEDSRFLCVAHSFDASDFNYQSSTKKLAYSGIYNSVLVIGENIKDTKTEIRFELKNEDPTDPHSIQNSGVKKVYKVNDYLNGIDTKQKAIERAYYELDLIRKNYSSININCATLLHLNENDVIVLEDPTVGENATARYIINSISRPIGTDIGSTMSVSRIYM